MHYRSKSRLLFEVFNYAAFGAFTLLILFPFANAIAISFSDFQSVSNGEVRFWPKGFNTASYELILTNKYFLATLGNTIFLTLVNTLLTIVLALAAGYALASKHMVGGKVLMNFYLIPMYFTGGLIPFYLMVQNLQLGETYWALILPVVVNVFYIIIFRNSIANVPAELGESAEMDGASDLVILFRIIFPVISPMVAAFVIFSAVTFWNEWFNVLLFISDMKKSTLQFWLRGVLTRTFDPFQLFGRDTLVNYRANEMAAAIVTILPVVLIYPFLQRFFIHGIIVGAVKG
ncbi:carbohydrate ABC transporter permease [Cohnella soli]|uniref:Carbohydrate ABC transporter permease n=1 Tax=Cohnella soli TaxID=425005 RepID=A0ABW0HPF7_9BACL